SVSVLVVVVGKEVTVLVTDCVTVWSLPFEMTVVPLLLLDPPVMLPIRRPTSSARRTAAPSSANRGVVHPSPPCGACGGGCWGGGWPIRLVSSIGGVYRLRGGEPPRRRWVPLVVVRSLNQLR